MQTVWKCVHSIRPSRRPPLACSAPNNAIGRMCFCRKHCETLPSVKRVKSAANIGNRTNKSLRRIVWISLNDTTGPRFRFIPPFQLRFYMEGRVNVYRVATHTNSCLSVCVCVHLEQWIRILIFIFRFVYECCSIHRIYWEHVFFFFVLWIICWVCGRLGLIFIFHFCATLAHPEVLLWERWAKQSRIPELLFSAAHHTLFRF